MVDKLLVSTIVTVSLRLGEEKKKEEERRKIEITGQKYNGVSHYRG